MHAESIEFGYLLANYTLLYREFCVYNGYKFVQHTASFLKNKSWSDPGFIFSVVLN